MPDDVAVDVHDGVLTLTLARPHKKNALTNTMYGLLADALAAAEQDPDVRVVLLQGDGDSFTVGNDIGEFAAQASGAMVGELHVTRFLSTLTRATKPIVAAVHGRAVGIGTTMLLHCDLVFVAEDALLSTPFVNLALVPEAASSRLLPARIGHQRAYALFALGETVDGSTAASWGLANQALPEPLLRDAARRAAAQLAARPASALAATKALMRDPDVVEAQMQREVEFFERQLRSAEAREAFAAFAARRAPTAS